MKARRQSARDAGTPLSDLEPDGMIHVATLRSPVPAGTIVGIETPFMPRGYLSVVADDIPGARAIAFGADQVPVLARGEVRYVGEPVALIAGPDPAVVAELAAKSVVKVESAPFVADFELVPEESAAARASFERGDVDIACTVAAAVVEGEYRIGSQDHFCSEPHGALCQFEYDKLVVRCATQWPSKVREAVASVLGAEPAEIIVRPTPLGEHLDGKLWYPALLACQAALVALKSGKPARVLLSRAEDYAYSPKRARAVISHRSALDGAGNLSALDVKLRLDVGAYGPLAREIVSRAVADAIGQYDAPNVRVRGLAVRTNLPPLGAFGGLGSAQAFFAIETHVDRVVSKLGADPIAWRAAAPKHRDSPFGAIARELASMSDFARKHASYSLLARRGALPEEGFARGIGFACAHQGSGAFLTDDLASDYRVSMRLDAEGRVSIRTEAAANRGKAVDVWRQIASRELDVPLSAVTVEGSEETDFSVAGPDVFSNKLSVVTKLVSNCATTIKRKKKAGKPPFEASSVFRGRAKAARNDDKTASPYADRSYGGAVVEVEIDPWGYEIRVLGVWICADCGEVLSERAARRSLETGAVTALSQALYERLDFPEGVPPTDVSERPMIRLSEIPPVETRLVRSGKDAAKGLGDLPYACVPSALAQAVRQATGVAASELPVPIDDICAKAAAS